MGNTERRNVFVIGAGASKEFGLPTGAELLEKIARLVATRRDGRTIGLHDRITQDALGFSSQFRRKHRGFDPEYFRALELIAAAAPIAPSIDNLLHAHKDDDYVVEVGKVTIARSIALAEKHSTLSPNLVNGVNNVDFAKHTPNTAAPGATWLANLFRLLVAEKDIGQFLDAIENITFISFNYDRCIEQFLINATKTYFALSWEQASKVSESIKVIHPYGSLGELRVDQRGVSGFGEILEHDKLLQQSENFRTFTEGLASKDLEAEIQTAFSNCDVAVFIGFGYLPLNMEILFRGNRFKCGRVIGSTLGHSQESTDYLRDELILSLLIADDNFIRARQFMTEKQISLSALTGKELIEKHYRYFMKQS